MTAKCFTTIRDKKSFNIQLLIIHFYLYDWGKVKKNPKKTMKDPYPGLVDMDVCLFFI